MPTEVEKLTANRSDSQRLVHSNNSGQATASAPVQASDCPMRGQPRVARGTKQLAPIDEAGDQSQVWYELNCISALQNHEGSQALQAHAKPHNRDMRRMQKLAEEKAQKVKAKKKQRATSKNMVGAFDYYPSAETFVAVQVSGDPGVKMLCRSRKL